MTNFPVNQQIPEEIKQIIRFASEDEVTEIMLQSLKMAIENPDELARAMPGMPKEMLATMKFFPKTDAALRPMAKVMAQLLIKQVKHGQNPSQEEVTKAVMEALASSGAFPGVGAGMPPGMGIPGINMPGMPANLPNVPGMPGVTTHVPAVSSGPPLEPAIASDVEKYIANGKNRLAEQDFEQAEAEFGKAVDLLDQHQPEGELMFNALQHQSIAQLEQAEYLKAEPVLKRWLRLGEKIYSPDHSLLAGAYLGLARVRESQQKWEDAEMLYKRALSIAEKTGEQDPEAFCATIDSVAYFYESRKRFKKADPLFERSYQLRKKIYEEDGLEVADFEIEYALVLNERGQHEDAIEWCNRAVATKKNQLGDDDTEALEASIQLAEILFDAKEFGGAEAIARNVVAKCPGSCGNAYFDALELLAQILRETGRDDEAVAVEKQLAESDQGDNEEE